MPLTRKLIQSGNSKALVISKEMLEHLGLDEFVSIEYHKDSIVLKRPAMEFDEALNKAHSKYSSNFNRK